MTIRVYGKHEVFTIINRELYDSQGNHITSGFLRIMVVMLLHGGVMAFEQYGCEGNLEYSWYDRSVKRAIA